MTGEEVYEVLVARGVTHLHHSNSVKTSVSQLLLGGLASRHLVEQRQLPQTAQYTDAIDRQYGIWADVFMDTVDIHTRISNRNQYGPVLFVLDIGLLRGIPEVLVTKQNPTRWNTLGQNDRYFNDADEFSEGFVVGDFGQMITARLPEHVISFPHFLSAIILDDPIQTDGQSEMYQIAARALDVEAARNGLAVRTTHRYCDPCNCINTYGNMAHRLHTLFHPN